MTGAGASRPIRHERSRPVRFLMQVLWPAFAAAALTSGLVFSALDPAALTLYGRPVTGGREGVYTAGFLVLWLLYAGACGVTWWITGNDAQRAARRGLGTGPDGASEGDVGAHANAREAT